MLPSFIRLIGSDWYLTAAEAAAAASHADPREELQRAWALYQGHFGGFCETGLDPMGYRFEHPARWLGRLALAPAEPVLVVGNGPSARAAMTSLARMRHEVRIFTSPRGAALLAEHDIQPDLVLVEHRTALDAQHSAQARADGALDSLRHLPLVAADWRTPACVFAEVAPERLFVPDPLPTWGWWPATAAALALSAGARRVGLLGIDLGTTTEPDPGFEDLSDLLGLLAAVSSADTVDCGEQGARKTGWNVTPLESLAGRRCVGRVDVTRRAAPSPQARLDGLARQQAALRPLVERCRHMLAVALDARAGGSPAGLERLVDEMLGWGRYMPLRVDVQEALGVSFLPRLWRLGVDRSLGSQLWRPLLLATHEVMAQAGRLETRARQAAA